MSYFSTKIDLQQLGLKFKNDFKIIRQQDAKLNSLLSALNDGGKELFFNISDEQQEEMRKNLKNLAFYIKELTDIYDHSEESSFDMPNLLSEQFKNTYQDFIYLIKVARISLKALNKKITNELNPKFDPSQNNGQ